MRCRRACRRARTGSPHPRPHRRAPQCSRTARGAACARSACLRGAAHFGARAKPGAGPPLGPGRLPAQCWIAASAPGWLSRLAEAAAPGTEQGLDEAPSEAVWWSIGQAATAWPRKQGCAQGLRGWHVTSIPVAGARALTGCQGPAQGVRRRRRCRRRPSAPAARSEAEDARRARPGGGAAPRCPESSPALLLLARGCRAPGSALRRSVPAPVMSAASGAQPHRTRPGAPLP